MKSQSEILTTPRFFNLLADEVSKHKYTAALLTRPENNLNFEVDTNNTGYERDVLKNSIAVIGSSGFRVISDPVTFLCKGNSYPVARAIIICEDLPDKPILGYMDLDSTLMDGDKLTIDLTNGFFQVGV